MRLDVITLFEELFKPFMSLGVNRRAFELERIDLRFWNPRDFAQGTYKRVDDRPFGGGPGMVMLAEPLALCVQAVQDQRRQLGQSPAPVILFSPVGERISHAHVEQLSASMDGAILICGRYEGLDQRFIDQWVTQQLSLGDFVLSGGEIACLALMDAVARLQPDVLNDQQSHESDSFHPHLGGLLDCPHYTRPEVWRGQPVPEVLMSGNHQKIERWRELQRLELTQKHRPDLLPPKLK
jgi:tRNA (guanine37-N1)-methyltransferase